MASTLRSHLLGNPHEASSATGPCAGTGGPDLPAGTKVGEFVIERRIGEGAMASVYAAIHPMIEKRAAVKVMNLETSQDGHCFQRFRQEARAVNLIRHPGVVNVFGYGHLDDGRCYLVMDLLEGQTLGERLMRGPLALDETLPILHRLCDVLGATHEQGIVHRDIKPENVFLVAQDRGGQQVKLLDFGIARFLDDEIDGTGCSTEGSAPLHTQVGDYIGTPSYNSPEQAAGTPVDQRSDVYSLGVLAFEMVTGQRPFNGRTALHVQAQHIGDAPPLARSIRPDVPLGLEALLTAMLAKDPSQRPTLSEVRVRLASVGSPTEVTSKLRMVRGPSRGVHVAATLLAAATGVALLLLIPARAIRSNTATAARTPATAAEALTPRSPPPVRIAPLVLVSKAPARAPGRRVRPSPAPPATMATMATTATTVGRARLVAAPHPRNYLLSISGRRR